MAGELVYNLVKISFCSFGKGLHFRDRKDLLPNKLRGKLSYSSPFPFSDDSPDARSRNEAPYIKWYSYLGKTYSKRKSYLPSDVLSCVRS